MYVCVCVPAVHLRNVIRIRRLFALVQTNWRLRGVKLERFPRVRMLLFSVENFVGE